MSDDRITEIRVQGLRTLEDIRLELGGLTVLIGENGTGKSSLVEAFELFRKAAAPDFVRALNDYHGGLPSLLRIGAQRLSLGLRVEGGGDGPLDYSFSIAAEGSRVVVERENLDLWNDPSKDGPLHLLQRTRRSAKYFDRKRLVDVPEEIDQELEGNLLLSAFGRLPPNPGITRAVRALRDGDVHVPPEVRARWVCRESGAKSPLRESVLIQPATRLARLGGNLANCFHTLRNNVSVKHWQETMELVRLGLGEDVESINTQSVPGGSEVALTMEIRGLSQQIPASAMSDGMLAYLAWVAVTRLDERSFLVVDEPESHMHPALLVRVLGMFESVARKCPVVLATHSDRLLDALTDPAASVVLCRLGSSHATELLRPKKDTLAGWLERYRGIGDLRCSGMEELVITEPA